VLFLALANWQWDRAHSVTGDWQNLGYALQWPLFAVVLVAGWMRFLWLEQHGPQQHGPQQHTVSSHRDMSDIPARAPAPAGRPTPEDDPDDELAAYNAYLARLAAEDRQR
jgi:DNA-binding transcriptional regulator of glucitol operon